MNPEQEIELLERLLDELIVAIEAILTSGEELSDEVQGLLAEEIAATMQRIDELRGQQEAPPASPQHTGTHPSSQINATRYNPKTKELLVKFQDKYPGQNGPVYKYDGIDPGTYSQLSAGSIAPRTSGQNRWHRWEQGKTPSLGASFNALIRDRAPYQRLS